MILYGGRFLRNKINSLVAHKTESRDAQVYDIDYNNHRCRVKIQGSPKLIIAHFPENMEQSPIWLKVGNAVRISHTSGNKGRIELIGNGILLVSPVSGDVGNPPAVYSNVVLTGLRIVAALTGDAVVVIAGTFQYNGVVYTVPPIDMSGYSAYTTPSNVDRDNIAALILIGGASGSYRYDPINVGTDLTIDKVTGDSATPPTFPITPDNHIRLGWIFRSTKSTILQTNINAFYSVSKVSQLVVSFSDSDLSWIESTSNITVTIKDQYDAVLSLASPGWHVQASISYGNGTLTYNSGTPATTVDGYTTSGSISFTYTRGGTSGDLSPAFTFSLLGYGFSSYGSIVLRDEDGYPM